MQLHYRIPGTSNIRNNSTSLDFISLLPSLGMGQEEGGLDFISIQTLDSKCLISLPPYQTYLKIFLWN
jgi:hypothetical protein